MFFFFFCEILILNLFVIFFLLVVFLLILFFIWCLLLEEEVGLLVVVLLLKIFFFVEGCGIFVFLLKGLYELNIFGVENLMLFILVVSLVGLNFLLLFLLILVGLFGWSILLNLDIDRDFLIKFKGMWLSILLKWFLVIWEKIKV